MRGKTGTSTSGIEVSPARKKRQARRSRSAERRWAAKSGPVVVIKPHVYWLSKGEVIDCGPQDDFTGWHIDFTEHHYFFARPTLRPL